MRGLFCSFEGIDGVGKSTQIARLEAWFHANALPVLRTREPGGTAFGTKVRTLLFEEASLSPLAEVFLFEADRAEHSASVLLPTLADGTHVITDRFFDSNSIYQGIRRNVGIELVQALSLIACDGLVPDCTFLLDLDPGERYATEGNHFDQETLHIQNAMRKGYLHLAKINQKRFVVLDATETPDRIHTRIVSHVQARLAQRHQHVF